MKTSWKSAVAATVIGAAMLAGAYGASPALRARMGRETQALVGWTEAARKADPVGFTRYVQGRLENDLAELRKTRRELAVELGELAKQEKEQQGLLGHAERLAAEFRTVYRQACDGDGQFPVSFRGAEYSRPDVESQVSLLLAEAEGYQQSLVKMRKVRGAGERRLEQVVVRINSTVAQLASIAAQRGILRARQLSESGAQLVAQVDQLLDANQVVLHSNPVRSVRELLAADEAKKPRPRLEVARRFLSEQPAVEVDRVDAPDPPSIPGDVPVAERPAVSSPSDQTTTPAKPEAAVTSTRKPEITLKPETTDSGSTKEDVAEDKPAELDWPTTLDSIQPNQQGSEIFQQK